MTTTVSRLVEPVSARDHLRGPWSAPVTLVEYGDYQCPYCRRAHPIVQELLAERPDTVLFAFRHFPLANVHPYAELAAEAAEAAATRERFWDMHDWLYEHQDAVNPQALASVAPGLGLPGEELRREVEEHAYRDRIRADFESGIRSGVNGTPTFFINGLRHDQGYDLPTLRRAVDAAS